MFLVTAPEAEFRGSLLLLHGSSAPMDHPFMERASRALAQAGLEVSRCEFAYMARRREQGKCPPPSRFPVLQQELRELWGAWPGAEPRFIGGKSLGARVAVSLADRLEATGALCLGYPFHPPGQPEKTRLEPFAGLGVRTLILQGTRDAFGRPAEVGGYALPSCVELCWLPGADHGYETTAQQPDPFQRVTECVSSWLAKRPVPPAPC